ncbi:hypothetical protein Lal_00021120 [Lupinus albus]|nr:hypothetical protein Lal_00021120 [Lupinus albus]
MNPLCEDRENRHCQLRPFRITILGDDSKGTKMGSSENLGFDEGRTKLSVHTYPLPVTANRLRHCRRKTGEEPRFAPRPRLLTFAASILSSSHFSSPMPSKSQNDKPKSNPSPFNPFS